MLEIHSQRSITTDSQDFVVLNRDTERAIEKIEITWVESPPFKEIPICFSIRRRDFALAAAIVREIVKAAQDAAILSTTPLSDRTAILNHLQDLRELLKLENKQCSH